MTSQVEDVGSVFWTCRLNQCWESKRQHCLILYDNYRGPPEQGTSGNLIYAFEMEHTQFNTTTITTTWLSVVSFTHSKELLQSFIPYWRSAAESLLPGQRCLQQTAMDQLHQASQGSRSTDRRPATRDRTMSGDRAGWTDRAAWGDRPEFVP